MITKEITKGLTLLEKDDVISAVSKMVGRDVELSEMDVTLFVAMPMDLVEAANFSGFGLYCELRVDGKDLYDEDYNSPLAEFFNDCEFYLNDDEIFAFDTNEFGSYCRAVDMSD